jgi:hypothetical protein
MQQNWKMKGGKMPTRTVNVEPMKIKVPDSKGGWKWIDAPRESSRSIYTIKKEKRKNEKS